MVGVDSYIWVAAVPLTFVFTDMPNQPWYGSFNNSQLGKLPKKQNCVVLEALAKATQRYVLADSLCESSFKLCLLIMAVVAPPDCQAVVCSDSADAGECFVKDFALRWLALAWLCGIFAPLCTLPGGRVAFREFTGAEVLSECKRLVFFGLRLLWHRTSVKIFHRRTFMHLDSQKSWNLKLPPSQCPSGVFNLLLMVWIS